MLSFFILLHLSNIAGLGKAPLLDNHTRYQYYHPDIFTRVDIDRNSSISILSLPTDVGHSIYGYLTIRDIRLLIRTCKSNLFSGKQYIKHLLCINFQYLLSHNESKITTNHLLKIPFVDSITLNALFMPSYFGLTNKTSAKYIGIDRVTGYGFISFLLKKIDVNAYPPPLRVLTFVFGEDCIVGLYLRDPLRSSALTSQIRLNPLSVKHAIAVQLIIQILLYGQANGITGSSDLWCLYDQWESCMFWPRIQAKVQCVVRCRNRFIGFKRNAGIISVAVFTTCVLIMIGMLSFIIRKQG